MFPKTRNIEKSFRLIRMTCIIVIVGCFGFSVFVTIKAIGAVGLAESRVYILASGKVLEAFSSDRKDNIPVEARDHIATYHKDFFTLDPDEKSITDNLTRSMYLVDETGKRVYENLKESGYYSNVVSSNITQRINIDSIRLDMTSYPFYFRLNAIQTITRPTSTVTRKLVTEGWLRDVSRSDNNPHGFLIERWMILENSDLKIEPR